MDLVCHRLSVRLCLHHRADCQPVRSPLHGQDPGGWFHLRSVGTGRSGVYAGSSLQGIHYADRKGYCRKVIGVYPQKEADHV